jgi:hypothetical protein
MNFFYCFWYTILPLLLIYLYPYLRMTNCSWEHTLSCLFMYCSFANIGHAGMMLSTVYAYCWYSLHLITVSISNTFIAWYLVCSVLSCAAIISVSISTSRSSLDSHRNKPYSVIHCLSILLMYCPCIILLSHFSATKLLIIIFYDICLPYCVPLLVSLI